MTRQSPTNLAASVRARLLSLSKSRGEDFTLTLVALETIRGFVLAPMAAAHRGASFDKQWAPGGPWR